jgi:hypothetical protein
MRYRLRMARPVRAESLQPTGRLILDRKAKRLKKTMRKRANACVNILKQCGWLVDDYERVQTFSVETIEFDTVDFVRQCIRHVSDIQRHFNRRPRWLLVGGKQFHDICGQWIDYPFSVPLNSLNGYPEFFGLQVHVLPWIDGIALVPEEYLPAREVPGAILVRKPSEDEINEAAGKIAAAAWNDFMGRDPLDSQD